MHVECSSCHARYVIADEKIPAQGARIRCRKCQAVFPIERAPGHASPPVPTPLPLIPPTPQETRRAVPAATSVSPAPSPQPAPSTIDRFTPAFAAGAQAVVEAEPGVAVPPAPLEAPAPGRFEAPTPERFEAPASQPPVPASAPEAAPASSISPFSSSAGIPEGLPEAERLKHMRARRFARVLASDIAIYNKEKRDRGVKDGNLVAVLGYEIKKSWEVYKERVTPELANSTPYFRDALNEMLAEGQKVF